MASTSGPSGRSIATPATCSLTRRRTRPPKPLPVLATWKRARIPPWSSTTPTAWVLVAQSMPAYSWFTCALLPGTMGAPSVPGRRAGCSLRGGPTRISLAPVLAPRPVGRRGSHAGPPRTSTAGGRPTGTEGSCGSLTPTTPSRSSPEGGWTNEHLGRDPADGQARAGGADPGALIPDLDPGHPADPLRHHRGTEAARRRPAGHLRRRPGRARLRAARPGAHRPVAGGRRRGAPAAAGLRRRGRSRRARRQARPGGHRRPPADRQGRAGRAAQRPGPVRLPDRAGAAGPGGGRARPGPDPVGPGTAAAAAAQPRAGRRGRKGQADDRHRRRVPALRPADRLLLHG